MTDHLGSAECISEQTVMDIALIYSELDAAERFWAEIQEAISLRNEYKDKGDLPHFECLIQLVCQTDLSRRVLNIPWEFAEPVLKAHVTNQRRALEALSAKAKAELNAPGEL